MEEANYRELSQQYAQGGIKAAMILNGGATIAVVSQISEISIFINIGNLTLPIILFVFGTFLGAITWILAFMSTRHVDRAMRGEDENYKKSNIFMHFGVAALSLSFITFLVGSLRIAFCLNI